MQKPVTLTGVHTIDKKRLKFNKIRLKFNMGERPIELSCSWFLRSLSQDCYKSLLYFIYNDK